MIRILVTEPEYFTPESLRMMKRVGRVTAQRMSRKELLNSIENFDAVVVRIDTKLDKTILRSAARLKCVVSATTGLNHIDTGYLKARGIPLFSLHGTHSVPTAEHAIGLLFSAARKIPAASAAMSAGGWERWRYIGTEIAGKTLGIIGIGRIGTQVAKRARALGMHVIAYDPYVSGKEVQRRGATKTQLRALLKSSDFITLHAPLTPKTEGLIDKKAFRVVKPSVVFINTSRGKIIDESALIEALSKDRIRAAAIDVYPEEPLPSKHRLRTYARGHGNLILTPHIAASTNEAVTRASMFAADAVCDFFSGKRP